MRLGVGIAWGYGRGPLGAAAAAACLALAAAFADGDPVAALAMLSAAVGATGVSVLSAPRPLDAGQPGIGLLAWAGMHGHPPRDGA